MESLRNRIRSYRYKLLGSPIGKLLSRVDPISLPRVYWSSYGEDAVIQGFLDRYRFITGVDFQFSYIDVGCFEPARSSNTFTFYRSGMKGTVVDPNRYLIPLWERIRPRDNFLPFACANERWVELNIIRSDAESNSVSSSFLNKLKNIKGYEVQKTLQVEARSLDEIITIHRESFTGEFMLDLDVEGHDFACIETCVFSSGRPFIALIETGLDTSEKREIAKLMNARDFELVSTVGITSVFLDKKNQFFKVLNT